MTDVQKNLFSPPEAVEYLGHIVEEQTLAVWRCNRRYPLPYCRIGRRIAYRKADLDAFVESRTVRPVDPAA